jgi:hypothetical protein
MPGPADAPPLGGSGGGTTCDIYNPGNSPPAAPDSQASNLVLIEDYGNGLEAGGETAAAEVAAKWTHYAFLADTVDVRDGWANGTFSSSGCSTLYVPNNTGTGLLVVFVERKLPGTPRALKKVYLRRFSVTWPTNDL